MNKDVLLSVKDLRVDFRAGEKVTHAVKTYPSTSGTARPSRS